MDQPVKDGIGQRGRPNGLMPVRDRQVAGDDRGPAVMPLFQQRQEVPAIVITERGQAPVVENEHVGFGQSGHELHLAAIPLGKRKLLEEPREAQGEDRPALAAGLMPHGAGQPGFANAWRAGDQHVMAIASPLTCRQAAHQRLVQPAWVARVDSLNTGGLPELRLMQTGLQPAILSGGTLPIHQQSDGGDGQERPAPPSS